MRQTWCFDHGSDQCDCFVSFMQTFMADGGDTHTREDLAMALELAQLMDDDLKCHLDHHKIGYNRKGKFNVFVWDWLRAEVIAALRGER